MERVFRLFDFNLATHHRRVEVVHDDDDVDDDDDDDEEEEEREEARFLIQMFGIDEQGKTCSVLVEGYQPFFYVKVDDSWNRQKKEEFVAHLRKTIGPRFAQKIVEHKLILRRKLYGFDGGKLHKFVQLKFQDMTTFNKVKNLWYFKSQENQELILKKQGYLFGKTSVELYEANIPPLLRFFHIREVSPSGWIALPLSKTKETSFKTTTCDYEFTIDYHHIIPLNDKETRVPYKIMSFDIEASSSHGDFPIPVKTYKKLATNIVDLFSAPAAKKWTEDAAKEQLRRMVLAAFGKHAAFEGVDLVYPKENWTMERLEAATMRWLERPVRGQLTEEDVRAQSIEQMFDQQLQQQKGFHDEDDDETTEDNDVDDNDDAPATAASKMMLPLSGRRVVSLLMDPKASRETKIEELKWSLRQEFPALEGDKVTFIGSTFVRYGEQDPYLNHCIVLNSCDAMSSVPHSVVETYNTEKEVLLAWTDLVQRENPDIVIGYNIFSFDYEFMFRRSQECNCFKQFLQLSRNKNEICATQGRDGGAWAIDKSSITLASGTYDLSIIKMPGRLQIDMFNWFRRTENLTSYKLDYVGGYFIGDEVKALEQRPTENRTRIKTSNMTGLLEESFIHFEEINHSSDYYKDGQKFRVTCVNKAEGYFEVEGLENPQAKKVKWGLAKDDVTPKDIFRMTNEGSAARAVIAKYCIQDCNLVHYLLNKVDVLTDLIEMAKLCSVPMSFLIFRGQGIKLTSYVAKKCREKRTLMPVIPKGARDDGYEGAIVLEPKCGFYLDQPVAVGDFASLYPSSMLSENLCPSSKVWTRTYDLDGQLLGETGVKDPFSGVFLYDNLPGEEYVNVRFDTFRYVRKTPKSRAEKVKSGYKICRYAQGKAIMPSILEELLGARKSTRKMIPLQKDDFMKNVLDKRQLAYKTTANSLYGQLGAKTSTFYEPDIAASTTATGRLLLTYAKRVVEECYGDTLVETAKHGTVQTRAEYVYGDTDSVFFTFHLCDPATNEPIVGHKALELTIEIAQEATHMVSSFLKAPHDFEYEKTFEPLFLLSKKRYTGMLYEFDPNKGKRKEMGIVLKRRDNAPIVKDVYGGIIDILFKERNIQKAMEYLGKRLQDLVDGQVPIEKLVISKSLNSSYKNPQQIAHKVLADRIASRDPGNKPASGDRIPFVYIVVKDKKALQGDKIETPTFIAENKLRIDYSFYITNQIMKPVLQLFGLVLEDIWRMQKRAIKISKFQEEVEELKATVENEEKLAEKIEKIRHKEVKALLFDKYLRETNNAKEGNRSIVAWFTPK